MSNVVVLRPWNALVRPLVVFLILVVATPMVPQIESQNLPLPVYEVSGTVYDRDGTPLDAASVAIFDDAGEEVDSTASASDGSYAFSGLASGTYNLTADHDCCSPGLQRVTLSGTAVEATGVDFYLVPQDPPLSEKVATISGRVYDRDTDQGLTNARLSFSNYYESDGSASGDGYYYGGGGYQYFEVLTGVDGLYSLDVNVGSIDVWADLEGYDYTRGHFPVEANLTLNVPMRSAEAGSVTLSGTVRSTSGDAVAFAWINVGPDYSCSGDVCYAEPVAPRPSGEGGENGFYYEPRNYGYASTEADEDGAWTLSTTSGRLRVYAYANEYLPDEEAVVAEDGDSLTVNLTLEPIPPDSVRVSGRVVDSTSGDGVAYAQISVENQQWGSYNWTQTDDEGAYEVWTKPGYTIVTASAYSWYYAPCPVYDYAEPEGGGSSGSSGGSTEPQPASSSPSCEGGEREHDYFPRLVSFVAEENASMDQDFDLVRAPLPDAEFVGWVVNASSEEGVPDVWVSFFNERTHDWGQAQTDEDGSFRIEVHAGYYTIRAYADGYFDAVANAEVGSGETMQVNLFAEPGEKRYGGYYGCCVAYASEGYASGGPGYSSVPASPGPDGMSSVPEGGPSGGEGVQAYTGEGGGLGAYDPESDHSSGDGVPSVGPMLLIGVLVAIALAIRLRRS